jgi:enoyl-CoA hydratase/carnithine racemase
MPNQLVGLEMADRIARVTLRNPPANVLSHAVLQELERIVGELEVDGSVRVVVLTGSGRFFSAGADIHELAQVNTSRGGIDAAARGQALFNHIERLDKPVLAAINGTCVGGGLELALACHVRLAAEGSLLGLPEVKLGLIPGFGGTQRLPRIVGPSKATELILTGASITAEEALRIGLVNRVVPAADLMTQATALAGAIVERGPLAVQAALRAIRAGLDSPLSAGLAREAELFGELCATPDKKEGIQAFLEKRAPKFGSG